MDSLPSTSNSISGSELAQDVGDLEQVDHLYRLYDNVLNHFLKIKNLTSKMDAAISAVIESFYYAEGHRFSEIDFNSAEMCCAFIFRYAAHGAALARHRILEALDHCPDLKCLLKNEYIEVVSLGCGPGNDMIGFCSAMSRSQYSGTLSILLTDAISNWRDYTYRACQLLSDREYGFGEASDLFQRKKVQVSFCPRRVPEQLPKLNIEQYHIILICKLESIMNRIEKEGLPEELHQWVSKSALILFIDTPFDGHLWGEWFDVLYLSEEDQDFCSGDRQMRRFGYHHDWVNSKSRIAVMRKK